MNLIVVKNKSGRLSAFIKQQPEVIVHGDDIEEVERRAREAYIRYAKIQALKEWNVVRLNENFERISKFEEE